MATISIRNFPDELKESLKKMARDENISISALVIRLAGIEIEHRLRKMQQQEAAERIESRYEFYEPSIDGKDSTALLREGRDSR